MSSLAGLKEGDPIMVRNAGTGKMTRRSVVKVGRVWLTDSQEDRYRIADGTGEHTWGHGNLARTLADFDAIEELRELNDVLRLWGLFSTRAAHQLTREQLREVVRLLRGFEEGKDHD